MDAPLLPPALLSPDLPYSSPNGMPMFHPALFTEDVDAAEPRQDGVN